MENSHCLTKNDQILREEAWVDGWCRQAGMQTPIKWENLVAVISKAIRAATPSRVIFLCILGFPDVERGKNKQ